MALQTILKDRNLPVKSGDIIDQPRSVHLDIGTQFIQLVTNVLTIFHGNSLNSLYKSFDKVIPMLFHSKVLAHHLTAEEC